MTTTTPGIVIPVPQPKPGRPPTPDDGVYYPDAYEVCPSESMFHFRPQSYMDAALVAWHQSDPTTLVASEMLIYYEPGNPPASVGPDVYVIPGVGSQWRRSYYLWLEGRVPTFAMEIASRRTVHNDRTVKRALYESWGVLEYMQYDPNSDLARPLLTPPLQGLRLGADGHYAQIPTEYDAAEGFYRVASETLSLELHGNREWFRFYDPRSGEYLPAPEELQASLEAERIARLGAEAQRDAAQAQRNRERDARLTAEVQRDAARDERDAAQQERDAAEARNQDLLAEIRRLRGEIQ